MKELASQRELFLEIPKTSAQAWKGRWRCYSGGLWGAFVAVPKEKKSCQEKRVYKALLIKACNLKEFPQSFMPRTAGEAGPKGQAPLSSSPTTFPLVLTSHEWPRTDPWVSLGLLPAPPPPPEQMPTLQPAGCREVVEVSPCGPTRPVAMVTAGVTQLHPFLATWPHPSEPGSSRLALAARTIPEDGGRRSSLALPRAPPLGGRPASAPPRLAALTDTERSGLQPQPGPQQPPRPAPFLEGRAALGGGTGTWGRPRQVRGGRCPGKPGIWVYDVCGSRWEWFVASTAASVGVTLWVWPWVGRLMWSCTWLHVPVCV